VYWLTEDMVMKFLPPGNKERVSYYYWCESLGIKSWAALIFRDPSGLNALSDFLSGFEEFMKK
jgi:hypothetical protein